MSAYGTATGVKDLLVAMRDAARQDQTTLGYLRTVEVAFPPLENVPLRQPCLYIVWTGSPEERIAGEGSARVKVAVHNVTLYCVVYVQTHDDAAAILGDGRQVGVAQLAEDVMDFFAGNLMSLDGLDSQNKPDIEAGEVAHALMETLDGNWMQVVALNYRARTRPFERD